MDFLLGGYGFWILVFAIPAGLVALLLLLVSKTKRFEKAILRSLMVVFGLWLPLALFGVCTSLYGAGHSSTFVEVRNTSGLTVTVRADPGSSLTLNDGESGVIDSYGGLEALVVSPSDGAEVVTMDFEYGLFGAANLLTIAEPVEVQ